MEGISSLLYASDSCGTVRRLDGRLKFEVSGGPVFCQVDDLRDLLKGALYPNIEVCDDWRDQVGLASLSRDEEWLYLVLKDGREFMIPARTAKYLIDRTMLEAPILIKRYPGDPTATGYQFRRGVIAR
jgi:hypothetical protein